MTTLEVKNADSVEEKNLIAKDTGFLFLRSNFRKSTSNNTLHWLHHASELNAVNLEKAALITHCRQLPFSM